MGERGRRRLVWDIPTRLFHWLIVALFAFSWWSAENRSMDWHLRSGLTMFSLLVFRLIWGMIGTDTARFSQFIRGPRGVWTYLRGHGGATVGHNPLGGWSVAALLLTLTIQVLAGLFAVDIDGIESGPLSWLIDFDQGRVAAKVHEVTFNILLALTALHVAAVLYYLLVRRQNLIGAMITGRKAATDGNTPDAVFGGWIKLAFAIALAAALGWWVAGGARS